MATTYSIPTAPGGAADPPLTREEAVAAAAAAKARARNPLARPFFEDKNLAFWRLQAAGWTGYLMLRSVSAIANGPTFQGLVPVVITAIVGYCLTLLLSVAYGYYRRLPRLLGDTSEYGACYQRAVDCHGYGLVDTIDTWGGLWKFGSGGMAAISNQYAAMPSLHFGWSTWCAIAMVTVIGRGRRRWLWFLYPATTLFCILVTGNHYWLDAFFGGVALTGGFLIATGFERLLARTGSDRRASPVAPA